MNPIPRLRLATVLTICAVVNVASIYLAQPLLPFIGESLDAGTGAMSVVQGLLQLAFGVGLVVFGILADTRERRGLLIAMAGGLLLAALLAALAPGYAVFLVASLLMGACAAVLPVLIATAAAAGDGRAMVGILSGAPLGVVVGRTLAGLLGQADWRLAFALSALSAAAIVLLLRTCLPAQPVPAVRPSMSRAVRDMAALTRLPRNVLVNMSNSIVYVGWSAVWTILAFLLKEEPFGFSALQIGLVGLVALGGAVSGQVAGRLQGRLGESASARACLIVAMVAGLALALAGEALALLLVALFVHNAAIWVLQAVNVPAAARRAGPERAARGTALLYLTNFIATAVGAVVGALVWDSAGWAGVGLLAAASCLAGLVFDLLGRGIARRPPVTGPVATERRT
jgi:predicted MFS family arabinose efflux permease